MPERVSMRQKRAEAPAWIFSWKRRGEPLIPKLIALAFAASLCASLLGLVKIRTHSPDPWGIDKATVIHVPNTPDGRALALTAQENGPSPDRFEPNDWPSLVRFQEEQMAIISQLETSYEPTLRPWPSPPPELPPVWKSETSVLPAPTPPPDPPSIAAAGKPHPTVSPLSGIQDEEIPSSLPRYHGPIDAAMLSGASRFMLRIDEAGRVSECIALSGGDTPEATRELELWLRGIQFPKRAGAPGWIALRISFLNQAP